MGVETKKQVILLIGASGGIGTALLEYLAPRIKQQIIPTFNKSFPAKSTFLWEQYNALNFQSAREKIEEISTHSDVVMIIDATGAFFANKLQRAELNEINDVIATNLLAPMILAKNAQEFMPEGGKVVFLSSIVGTMDLVGSSIYAASKAGLERGVIALAPEYSQSKKGICAIRLGYMDYGMTYKIEHSRRSKLLEQLPDNEFISITKLGSKIQNILSSSVTDINGRIFEVA